MGKQEAEGPAHAGAHYSDDDGQDHRLAPPDRAAGDRALSVQPAGPVASLRIPWVGLSLGAGARYLARRDGPGAQARAQARDPAYRRIGKPGPAEDHAR